MTNIAVLMAVYGKDDPHLLARALSSTLNQAVPDGCQIRIFLGIDGPIPQELETTIESFRPRIHLISRSSKNVGLASTLNRLISQRSDELFFFRMDADDVSLPGRFMAQLSALAMKPEIDILGTAIWECTSDGTRRLVRFAATPEDARRLIDRRVPVAHATVCMRRRVLDAVESYPERRGNEDIALWFKCFKHGLRFDNLPDAWYEVTVSDSFWQRRSVEKAFGEFRSYVEGIWALDGITWRYIFPIARLALRLSPEWVSRRMYASRLRS